MIEGNTTDAEDIFQKALLQIVVRYKKEKFQIKTSFEGYLFTVCKNLWRCHTWKVFHDRNFWNVNKLEKTTKDFFI